MSTDTDQIDAICCFDKQAALSALENWTDEQRTPQHLTLGNVETKFLICNFKRDAIYRLTDVVSFG